MLSFCITAKLYIFTADMKCIIIKLINMGGGGVFFRHMEAVQELFR